ncbi:hypothetical protein BASA81_001053 [Batrachochytrium salamandrivorans]|nr:hypothetical protein BASA81_001053 [Batrachochytrium salamandrivorans]
MSSFGSSGGNPKGLSGWLRKRPTFAGFWPNRFVQLTEDGKLVIYTHDYSKAEADANHLVVALYTVHIPKLVQIDPVYEHFVRTTRAGIKSERVFVIRARFKNHVLFTLGAPTIGEANQWKVGLESAATARGSGRPATESLDNGAVEEPLEAPPLFPQVTNADEQPIKVRKSHSSMVPDNWKQNSAMVWKVVEERDGLKIEGAETSSNQFPILRAVCEVRGSAKNIFDLVMDHESVVFTTSRVVKRLNDTSDIVYMQTREISVGPVHAGPRDLVLLRYWRMDEEGDFVITWQSIEDSSIELKSPEGFCRGKIFSMSLHVVPNTSNSQTCTVRIHCHADPGGNMSYATQSMLMAWITPFVTGVLGIEPALDAKFRGAAPVALDTFEEEEEPMVIPPTLKQPPQEELQCGTWRFEEWMQTPEDEPFNVRGKTYLSDRIKYPSKQHKFILVAADLNTCDAPVHHCAARSDSPLTQIRERYPNRQVFVMQFIMPGPPFYILCMYAVAREGVCEEDSPFARLWTNFVEGTDEYRNTMFKMIPRVTKGSFIVKKTVGQVPAILGTKVKLNYYTGPNYIEVDVDLNTSAVAGSILSVVKGYATTFVADLTLLLEGHSEDELPEEIIVGFRMVKPHLSKALRLGPDPNPELTKQRIAIAENSRAGELKKSGKAFQ